MATNWHWLWTLLAAAAVAVFCASTATACNEAVCGSIVSKCLLLRSCDCLKHPIENCTCCQKCLSCLGHLHMECCSCVDICPKPNITQMLNSGSFTFDFPDPMPDLFIVLLQREFTVRLTYPVDRKRSELLVDAAALPPSPTADADAGKKDENALSPDEDAEQARALLEMKSLVTVNCTVGYYDHCVSVSKCKQIGASMGAGSARWFPSGCCEVVDAACPSYGVNEPRCLYCTGTDEEDDGLDQLSEEELEQIARAEGIEDDR